MKTNNKSSSTHLAMTFLFLSLAIVPVSMKAAGFNPKLSAVVDAWNRIASIFGDGYQSASTTELLALNQSNTNEATSPAEPSCCLTTLLASLEEPSPVESESAPTIATQETASRETRKQCSGATKRSIEPKRIQAAFARSVEKAKEEFQFRIVAHDVQEMTSIAPVIPAEAFKAFERRAAVREFNFNRVLRNLPLPKEVKVNIKAKSFTTSAVPQITRCGASSNPNPAPKKEWLWSMMPARLESAPPATSETSEL